jgi:FkbM family methyltransferase
MPQPARSGRVGQRRKDPPPGSSPERICKEGIAPATVIDVGAGGGTNWLTRAFPDAYHVMIEPQRELEHFLREHLETVRGEIILTAVAERDGESVFHVDSRRPLTSSLYEFAGLPYARESRVVPMATLDRLAAERGWEPPFGLKIDAQGAEHLVIRGAAEVLRQSQFVITVVLASLAHDPDLAYGKGKTFAEFIALMDERGFGLRDIVNAVYGHASGQLLYVDGYFMPYATRDG